MKALTLLKRVGTDPGKPVLLITAEEAMEKLLEAIKKYCPKLKITKMTGEDIKALLDCYSYCIIEYHPDSNHQERGALLAKFEMLKRYGLKDNDYRYLDFC